MNKSQPNKTESVKLPKNIVELARAEAKRRGCFIGKVISEAVLVRLQLNLNRRVKHVAD
jgi:hypothetical protein